MVQICKMDQLSVSVTGARRGFEGSESVLSAGRCRLQSAEELSKYRLGCCVREKPIAPNFLDASMADALLPYSKIWVHRF